MKHRSHFTNLAEAGDIRTFGGKAASLARLLQAGFHVPSGFVLSVGDAGDLLDENEVPILSAELQRLLSSRAYPKMRLAVRSSGVEEDGVEHSFAGMYQTHLNVEPRADLLLDAMRDCVRSSGSDLVRDYRASKNLLNETNRIAVVVQNMVDAACAGVAFSRVPTDSGAAILIECVLGLGDALVSGKKRPARLVIPRNGDEIDFSSSLREGEEIAFEHFDKVAEDLCRQLVRIELLFGVPQDVEWAYDGKDLWILQSRPITRELRIARSEIPTALENALAQGYGASHGQASGPVSIVHSADEDATFKAGGVLVARNTDSYFLPMMLRATAFITEEGGLLSHAALVARELKIPCAVGVVGACSIFLNGQIVTVDGRTGAVYEGTSEAHCSTRGRIRPHDFTALYCFDTVQGLTIDGTSYLVEAGPNGLSAWAPPLSPERTAEVRAALEASIDGPIHWSVSDKYQIHKAWSSRMKADAFFRGAFLDLFTTTLTLDEKSLEQGFERLFSFARKLCHPRVADTKVDSLWEWIQLYTASGCYFLANTIFPEGYGIRAVYQAASPIATGRNQGFGEWLADPKNSGDPAILYYNVLAESRRTSYVAYKEIGATGKTSDSLRNQLAERVAEEYGFEYDENRDFTRDIVRILEGRPEIQERLILLAESEGRLPQGKRDGSG